MMPQLLNVTNEFILNREITEVDPNLGSDLVRSNKFITTQRSDDSGSVDGTYLISDDGTFMLTFDLGDGETDTITGTASEDGNTAIFGYSEFSDSDMWGSVGIGVGVKKGSGFTLASLDGTYVIYDFDSGFHRDDPNGGWGASDEQSLMKATVTFDGKGTVTSSFNESILNREITEVELNLGSDLVRSNKFITTQSTDSGTVIGTYTVLGDGTFTLTFDVGDGETDTITGTASEDGNTAIFGYSEFSDSDMWGSAGIGVGVKSGGMFTSVHPEAAMIQSRFEAAMARFNAGDFSPETGFALYISDSYLDSGEDKTTFVAEAQADWKEYGTTTWTIDSILGAGDYAAIALTWGDGEKDTLYFYKGSGVWMLYGNQKLFDVWASSGHQMYSDSSYPYWVSLAVGDPDAASGITVSGVNVKGPGLQAEGISLYHDNAAGRWHSWSQDEFDPNLNPQWATEPMPPLDYFFTISYSGPAGISPEIQTFRVNSFVNAPPQASLTPIADSIATRPLTFSWESAGEGYSYRLEVNDANYNRIWEIDDLTGTSVVYDGPTLGGGQYYYNLITEDGFDNMSMINVSFQMPLLYPRTAVTTGTGTDNHPAWSPDGQKIAFTSNLSGVDNIWVVNRDGSDLTQLTTFTGYQAALYPSWSPDGTRIAFIMQDTNPAVGGFGNYFLYTMNPNGSGQTICPLPPRNSEDPDQFWEFYIDFTQWLDNNRIMFVSDGPDGGSSKFYSYRLSTEEVTQIIPDEVNSYGEIYKISWNAATQKLAFDRWPIGIQTMSDAGTNYQVLNVPTSGQIDTPAQPGWNPDGDTIAFVKNFYDVSDIAIFDTAAETVFVENTATDDEWPVWSPDGGSIAFVSDGKIWLMTPIVSVAGTVYDWTGATALEGVTVDLLGSDSPQSTATDGNGSFTIYNIAAGQSFYLRFQTTGLPDVYTGDLAFSGASASVDMGTYNLPTDADLNGFSLETGKGLITGRVLDQQFGSGGRVGGAVVTATSTNHPASGYTVTYRDPLGNLGGTATYGNGRYYVLNVDDEDIVTVTAAKANRSPAWRTFHTFGGAVNEGSVYTGAPAYDISLSGAVYDAAGVALDGALVEIDRYPAKSSTSDATRGYLLGNLPRDVNMNLKITQEGYVTAYTGGFNLGANVAGVPLTLFTQSNLDNMVVTAGNGLITGMVVSDAILPLAGAVIKAASNKGQTYSVNYGQGGGTATLADGTFWVPNVVDGDVVTITVAHPGYIYSGVTYLKGYADAVTENIFIGTLRKGDINGDVKVNLTDAILALQVVAGMNPTGIRSDYETSGADVNGDGRIGLAEVVYILQYVGGFRQ